MNYHSLSMMKRLLFTGYLAMISLAAAAQTFIQPNYGLKSHETLTINKVEASDKSIVLLLSLENRITGGSFCVDRNTYIVYPDGTRLKMTSASGIPLCPEAHRFSAPGDKLTFTLTFPSSGKLPEWIDLIEDCTDNCFHFYGITLDNDLNQKINDAFGYAGGDDILKGMISFIDILEETDQKNLGSEGLLYVNIISLAREAGNPGQAASWYNRLRSSEAPKLQEYIKFLNDQGIRY